MGWTNTAVSVLQAVTVIVTAGTPESGIFVYNGPPALGNLIGSWTAAAGTDSVGNNYPAGLSLTSGASSILFSQVSGTWRQSWISGKANILQTAHFLGGESGGPTGQDILTIQSSVDTTIQDGAGVQLLSNNTAGTSTAQVALYYFPGGGGQILYVVANNTGLSLPLGFATQGNMASQPSAAGNTLLSGNVGGTQAFDQLRILIDRIAMGPGTSARDIQIARTGIGQLAITNPVTAGAAALDVDGTITSTEGTASTPTNITTDTWHQAALTGTWVGSGNGVNGLWYRLTIEGNVHIVCDLKVPTTPGTIFTLPAGYIPATTQNIPAGSYASGVQPHMLVDTSGNITGTSLGASGTFLIGNFLLPLATL